MAKSSLGTALREAREKKGLSPEKLAVLSGVSRNMIKAAERGGNISVAKLEKIVNALGMTEVPMSRAVFVSPPNLPHLRDLVERIANAASELVRSIDQVDTRAEPPLATLPGATADILQHVRSLPRDQQIRFRDTFLEGLVQSTDEENGASVLSSNTLGQHEKKPSRKKASRRTK